MILANALVTPGIGLIFWMVLTFGLLLILLKKFAWKPILGALKERETSIEEALMSAEAAKAELQNLTNENEKLLAEARKEKDLILKEARELKDSIVSEAKDKATLEANKIISNGKLEIDNKRKELVNEVETMVTDLSIAIAEKILRQELSNKGAQEKLVKEMMKDVAAADKKAAILN